MNLVDETFLQGQLGLPEKKYQKRLLLMDLDYPARKESERSEPVESLVVSCGDIYDPATLSGSQVSEQHYSGLYMRLRSLTAPAPRNRVAVRTFSRMTEQRTDVIRNFGREKMLERAGVRFYRDILSDIEYVDKKPLGQPVAPDDISRLRSPLIGEIVPVVAGHHEISMLNELVYVSFIGGSRMAVLNDHIGGPYVIGLSQHPHALENLVKRIVIASTVIVHLLFLRVTGGN